MRDELADMRRLTYDLDDLSDAPVNIEVRVGSTS
jgi:hypothetical protein